jgi:hypothetical protein
MNRTYTAAQVEKFRKQHDVTRNGVAFDWWLASCEGAGFCLIREQHHTDADIELAKKQLHGDRDVVGRIQVATVKENA